MPQTLPVSHRVSLRQVQARRADSTKPAAHASPDPDFEDTVPLLFRSEAFAEDIDLQDDPPAQGHPPRRLDAHVLAAGAAVLHKTLAALKAASQPALSPLAPVMRSPRRASGWV